MSQLRTKQLIYLLADVLLIGVALTTAFLLRLGASLFLDRIWMLLLLLPIVVVVKITIFYLFGFYGQLWRYASLREGLRLLAGTTTGSLIVLGLVYFLDVGLVPKTVVVIDWHLTTFLIGGSYFAIRAKGDLFSASNQRADEDKERRAIIVGAGQAGSMLVKHMQRQGGGKYKPIAFLDDDPLKNSLMIHGVKVVGNSRMITSAVARHQADEVVLAVPSAANRERRRMALECQEIGIPCKTIPDIAELMDGKVSVFQIKDIDLKELLGREEVEINLGGIADCYKGKTILITGAAGSIGSEICRQIFKARPKKVIAVDISENGLYHLEEEMIANLGKDTLCFEAKIMDVRNNDAVERTFRSHRPDIVFHAAAYKHVPIMERHPVEAVENNFLGTRTMIEKANKYGSERFVFVSTDKAVNPTNIMGLSKQLGEQSIKMASRATTGTKYMAVRFGNVLGSSGSVIPKFKRQINNGETITVTHPDITRYFMTIQEAVYLVIQATAMGNGGEVFVLDMGEPVRILDLARSMIRLSGLEPDKDISVNITGLRPGEKLYEELFAEDETVSRTVHPQIYEALKTVDEIALEDDLTELEIILMKGDTQRLQEFIQQLLFDKAEHIAQPGLGSPH